MALPTATNLSALVMKAFRDRQDRIAKEDAEEKERFDRYIKSTRDPESFFYRDPAALAVGPEGQEAREKQARRQFPPFSPEEIKRHEMLERYGVIKRPPMEEKAREGLARSALVPAPGLPDPQNRNVIGRLAAEAATDTAIGKGLTALGTGLKAAATPLIGRAVKEGAEEVAEDAPVYYSQLEEVVEGMKQPLAVDTVEKALLSKGVKAGEMRDTQIDALVREAKEQGKKSLTKDEILEHVREARQPLEDFVKGGAIHHPLKAAHTEAGNKLQHELLQQSAERDLDADLIHRATSLGEKETKAVYETPYYKVVAPLAKEFESGLNTMLISADEPMYEWPKFAETLTRGTTLRLEGSQHHDHALRPFYKDRGYIHQDIETTENLLKEVAATRQWTKEIEEYANAILEKPEVKMADRLARELAGDITTKYQLGPRAGLRYWRLRDANYKTVSPFRDTGFRPLTGMARKLREKEIKDDAKGLIPVIDFTKPLKEMSEEDWLWHVADGMRNPLGLSIQHMLDRGLTTSQVEDTLRTLAQAQLRLRFHDVLQGLSGRGRLRQSTTHNDRKARKRTLDTVEALARSPHMAEMMNLERKITRDLGSDRARKPTYEMYTAPGPREDYREILIRAPGGRARATHFEGPRENYRDNVGPLEDVLAHTRVTTRTDKEGRRILFIDEIQSDWHQGPQDLYERPNLARMRKQKKEIARLKELIKSRETMPSGLTKPQEKRWVEDQKLSLAALQDTLREEGPDMAAGSHRKTQEWVPLVLKRLFRMAADEGYDGVAIAPGYEVTKYVHFPAEKAHHFYDKIVASHAKKIAKKREMGEFPTMTGGDGMRTYIYPLTDELRERLKKPQKLYSPLVGAGAAAEAARRTMEGEAEGKEKSIDNPRGRD